MANYIRTEDNNYPHSESSIRSANPQTSFPALFRADGYEVVFPAPQPVFNVLTQSVREIAPALTVLGTWEQRWEVVALDAETIAVNQAAATKRSITNQITTLEASITNRRIREAIRGSGKQWLDGIDDQIVALRAQL